MIAGSFDFGQKQYSNKMIPFCNPNLWDKSKMYLHFIDYHHNLYCKIDMCLT